MGAAQRHVHKHAQYYCGFHKKTSQSDYYHHICVLNDPSCKKNLSRFLQLWLIRPPHICRKADITFPSAAVPQNKKGE